LMAWKLNINHVTKVFAKFTESFFGISTYKNGKRI
jgi:hypothetical protein